MIILNKDYQNSQIEHNREQLFNSYSISGTNTSNQCLYFQGLQQRWRRY